MDAAVAAALFVGLPVALWLLVTRSRRRTRRPDLDARLTEVEQVVVYQDQRLTQVEQRLAALEQAQAPLYRVQ